MAGTVSDTLQANKIKSLTATDMVIDADGTSGITTFKSDSTSVAGIDNNGVYTSETQAYSNSDISTKLYMDTELSNKTPTAPTITHILANSPYDQLSQDTVTTIDYQEAYDTLGEYTPYQFNPSNNGYYLIHASLMLEIRDRFRENDYFDIRLYVGSTEVRTSRFYPVTTDKINFYPFAYIRTVLYLTTANTLYVKGYQNADNYNMENSEESFLTISRIL